MKTIAILLVSLSSRLLASTAFVPSKNQYLQSFHGNGKPSIDNCALMRMSNNGYFNGESANPSSSCQRRDFLNTAASLAILLGHSILLPSEANAAYGEDAKMVIPDIVQSMSDRTNKQCLVENLGNRDCLVYLDPENQLYKGSDAQLQFQRLEGSFAALRNIPQYIDSKQWNKVQSVLTGPMGTLSSTMNELVKGIPEGNDNLVTKCKSLTVDIRKELYAISAAVDKKQGKEALVHYEKAVLNLEKFVSLANNGPAQK